MELVANADGAESEIQRIKAALQHQVGTVLHRRGLVVAVSGGIDSSVCFGLAVKAFGPKRVLALALPEDESDPISLDLATELAGTFGVELIVENIGPALRGLGCYDRRITAIQRILPEFTADWRFKVVLPGDRLESDKLNVSYLEAESPSGETHRVRIPGREYREIIAATNFKQRVRKIMEYHHADRLHYAVTGTPNRLEYDQGFFVKGGDGLADVKPIAHLYKTQVYTLARALGVPQRIIDRPPTTDTFSLPQSQEEFYFSLPARVLDQLVDARTRGLDAVTAAGSLGMTVVEVERAYKDIDQKRTTTRYLHQAPLLVEPVPLGEPAMGAIH